MSDVTGSPAMLPPEPSSFSQTSSDGNAATQTEGSELYQGFLKDVDPRDLPVVQKYVRPWDQQVNARFREIHQQYEPYKKLGVPYEDLQAAVTIAQLLDNDPEYVWRTLGQEFGYGGQTQQTSTPSPTPAVAAGNGGNGAGNGDPYSGQLPEPFVAEFGQMRELVTALAQEMLKSRQQTQQQQQDQQLEEHLTALKKKYGDFDEDFVISHMWRGKSGDDAVQAYKQLVQNALNSQASRSRPVPPVLGGGGAVPAGVNPAELSRKDAKGLMAQMLEQAARAGQ